MNGTPGEPTLMSLPQEVLVHILANVSLQDIASVLQVHSWYRDAANDEMVWKGLLARLHPDRVPQKSSSETWKQAYRAAIYKVRGCMRNAFNRKGEVWRWDQLKGKLWCDQKGVAWYFQIKAATPASLDTWIITGQKGDKMLQLIWNGEVLRREGDTTASAWTCRPHEIRPVSGSLGEPWAITYTAERWPRGIVTSIVPTAGSLPAQWTIIGTLPPCCVAIAVLRISDGLV